jgi:hypothetical protein
MDRSALTVIFLDPADAAMGAVLLCDLHQRRVAVPEGWSVRDAEVTPAPVDAAPAAPGATESVATDDAPVERASITAAPAVADESRPLLRRAFRAASPGSALDREPRGLSWLERLRHEVDGGPQHATERMEDERQHDGDADRDREHGDDGDLGRRHDDADDDRAHDGDHGEDGVQADGTDEMSFLALEDEPATGTMVGHLQPSPEDLALPAHGAPHGEGTTDELPPARRRRGVGHGAQRMDNLTLFSDLSEVALGA